MKRRIPYAVANYEKIVRDNYYFVDKTRFIHELEKYEIPVFLRPRRFGKSLWCSILECYPELSITRHVACTISATDHRFFTLG